MHWNFNSVCTLLQYSFFHNSSINSPAISFQTHALTLTNLDVLEWQHVKSIRVTVIHLVWVNVYLSKAWKSKLIWNRKSLHKGQMHKKGSSYFTSRKRAGKSKTHAEKYFMSHLSTSKATYGEKTTIFLDLSSIESLSHLHLQNPTCRFFDLKK